MKHSSSAVSQVDDCVWSLKNWTEISHTLRNSGFYTFKGFTFCCQWQHLLGTNYQETAEASLQKLNSLSDFPHFSDVMLMRGCSFPVNHNRGLRKGTKFANFKRNRQERDSPIPHLLWKLLYSSARRCFTPSGSVWDVKKAEAISEADTRGNSRSNAGNRMAPLSASHLHKFCVKRLHQHGGKRCWLS